MILKLTDTDWKRPALVAGRGDAPLRAVAAFGSYPGVIVMRVAGRELTEEFCKTVEARSRAGERIVLHLADTNGALHYYLARLFAIAGVKIIFRISRYENLWLPGMLAHEAKGFSFVTLGERECVVDYGAPREGLPRVVRDVFDLAPPAAGIRSSAVDPESLRKLLAVTDEEFSQ